MKRADNSEEKIIPAVKQVEGGRKAAEVAREMGISEATMYAWKSKYGGMQVSDAKRLRQLEDENRRLKHLVADLSLDKEVMKAIIAKHGDRNGELREKLVELARQKPRYGYRRLGVLPEREGESVNHKRLWRVYQQPGLGVRRRERKRLERGKAGMPVLSRPKQEWSIDFVSDALANGRAIRALTLIDGFTKESPAIEVDASLSAPRITRVLDEVIEQREQQDGLRLDNGPEFTSR